jgi:hypothetical protein
MSTTVIIGNKTFEIPDPGEKPGWGEDTTDYLIAIAEALSTVQGPNDILQSSATLANNVSSPIAVSGFSFSTADVLAINCEFFVTRVFDSGSSVITESGNIIGSFDGSIFSISVDSEGDSGVTFDITNTGQITYVSSDLTNHVSSTIVFKGATIDQTS